MLEVFGYTSGVLMILSAIPYTRSILQLKTKPHRVTWFIWTVLIFIALFSQFAKGGTWSLLLTIGDGIAILIVFILSFKYGTGGFKKIDIISLFGAGVSLILWYLTKEPAVVLFLIILIDIIGLNLTVMKTWKNPENENWVGWGLCAIGGFFGILSVGVLNLTLLSYPVYIFLANLLMTVIILARRNYKKYNTKNT